MEALICGILIALAWLTYLTHKARQQMLENKKLQRQNDCYLAEIDKLKRHVKKENQKDEEASEKE